MLREKGISASGLKYLACLFMLIDHTGYLLFPHIALLRIIGRLAFPIFAFMIANGYLHTSSPAKYLLRLAVFAGVFQWFYGFMMADGRLSILFTLATGLGAVWLSDTLDKRIAASWAAYGCQLLVLAAASVLAQVAGMDYGWYGVAMIYASWLFFDRFPLLAAAWALLTAAYVFVGGNPHQLFSLAALAPLFFYNGKLGAGGKWFFYIFYAAHITVLYLLKIIAF